MRFISGRPIRDLDYEVTVEHRFLFWRWRQVYRGYIIWKRYPQGTDANYFMCDWLDTQVQQYKWSKEHPL